MEYLCLESVTHFTADLYNSHISGIMAADVNNLRENDH